MKTIIMLTTLLLGGFECNLRGMNSKIERMQQLLAPQQAHYQSDGDLSCEDRPCENGGICVDSGLTYACLCSSGFKGVNCELKDDPCGSQPCGIGKCSPWTEDYICECPNKVYDKCCCNGIKNKCANNQYYAHNATSFVHCDAAGNAYLKSCSPGLVWDQSILTCNRPSEISRDMESDQHDASVYVQENQDNFEDNQLNAYDAHSDPFAQMNSANEWKMSRFEDEFRQGQQVPQSKRKYDYDELTGEERNYMNQAMQHMLEQEHTGAKSSAGFENPWGRPEFNNQPVYER